MTRGEGRWCSDGGWKVSCERDVGEVIKGESD